MLSIAIARNKRERRIAIFQYFNKDADLLMKKLQARNIPAVANWITETQCIPCVAWTTEYSGNI